MNTSSAETTHHGAGSGRTRASGAHPLRTGLAAVLVLLGTFAGLTMAGVTPAGAATLNAVATLANPVSQARLGSGGSNTTFTVTLPKVGTTPAKCSGDTQNHGYHVYSYLDHPVGVKPTAVTYKTGLPSTGFGFVTNTGNYYGKANTAPTTGEIVNVPNTLQFAPLLKRGLTLTTLLYASGHKSGTWEGGIACANAAGTVTDYWNTPITFTSSTTDANKFVWSIPVFHITTVSLPSAKPGAKVSDTLKASGGKSPYTWAATKPLPSGLKLSTAGVLSGTLPKTLKAGKYTVDVKVTDSSSPKGTSSATLVLTVT